LRKLSTILDISSIGIILLDQSYQTVQDMKNSIMYSEWTWSLYFLTHYPVFIHAEESDNVLEVEKGGRKTNEMNKLIGLLYTMNGIDNNSLENSSKIDIEFR